MQDTNHASIKDLEQLVVEIGNIVSPVYLTGGSLRDHMMGKIPSDFDLSTPLLPQNVEENVRQNGYKAYISGRRYGTIGFKYRGHGIQITTFRTEIYTEGNRKPKVSFVERLEDDLSRRDFTMNAMALSNGKIIDPFGGRADIQQHLIRAVGDPELRFSEDPLRLLRALRFIAELGFSLDMETRSAIEMNAYRIVSVSPERVMGEMNRLLLGPSINKALVDMFSVGILRYLIPELLLDAPHIDRILQVGERLVMSEHELAPRWAIFISGSLTEPDARKRQAFGEMIIRHTGLYLKWSKSLTEDVFNEFSREERFSNGE